jgi:hypothetical protein
MENVKKLLHAVGVTLLGTIGMIVIYGGIGYLIYWYWRPVFEFIYSRSILAVAIPLFGTAFAFFLYLLRSLARVQYGFTEIMFGVVAMIAAANTLNIRDQMQTVLIQVAASIYIVVRGLDNIKLGLDKDPGHWIKKIWDEVYGEDGLVLWNRIKAAQKE